jgi:Ca-activated chloride channel family protein
VSHFQGEDRCRDLTWITPVLAVLMLGARAVPAAALQAPPSGEQKKTASVSVGTVLVPVVVTDARGRTVAGLSERDFSLLVDWRPVALDLFTASSDAPVSFTILLDGSGSMGLAGKMEGARSALQALVLQARPGDDFSLYVFARGAVRQLFPFTHDGLQIVRAAEAVKPWGKTAFFDALAKMPDRTLLGSNGSRAIVILTDGFDNASVLTRERLTELLEGIDVPVYPIGLRMVAPPVPGETPERDVDLELLKRIAFQTGGRFAITEDPKDLREAIRDFEKDLRSQYLLGFSPTGQGPVKYRAISVTVGRRIGAIRTRSGYRGTEPPWKEAPARKKGSAR